MDERLKQSIDHLLSLKEDWDDEGAVAFKQETIDKALGYIPKILSKIKELWNLDLKVEYFAPCSGGSIDIEWHKDGEYDILFNIPPKDLQPTYSGELKDGKNHLYGDLK